MTRDIDGWHIAAQVRFLRQVHRGAILVVEGESDDKALYRFIDPSACEIEVGFGKPNVLKAMDLLEEEGFSGVVALVDADFDRILNITYNVENICITDDHDLDLTIFSSEAFDHYVREHADPALIKTLVNDDLLRLREIILENTLPLAFCKLASARLSLNIYFKDIRHNEFIDAASLTWDLERLLTCLIQRSNTSCNEIRLKLLSVKEAAAGYNAYEVVSGHDAAAVFGIALRSVLGKRHDVQTWASEIEAGLRLAFSRQALERTRFYECLSAWQLANPPYRIFA